MEPFSADDLDAQLADQTKRFLANPEKFKIDAAAGTLYISPIFKWFGEDFTNEHHPEKEEAVISFISGYLNASDRAALRERTFNVVYLRYDWGLNRQ